MLWFRRRSQSEEDLQTRLTKLERQVREMGLYLDTLDDYTRHGFDRLRKRARGEAASPERDDRARGDDPVPEGNRMALKRELWKKAARMRGRE